ncbi:MAG: DegT/DnrJ/EryC1/StrS family aminotransferase [Deltaproteobacteria bacterium]|nr:DegT/DnrJ/EryC1/StrS family aminotransferase [Deltaproteobacteria bacterium]
MFSLNDICTGREAVFFGYARTALEYGFRYLGLQNGDEVLYPDLICDVMMVPCTRLGINVRFYRVNESLEPDFESISGLIRKKTKAILAVNYFGFPQEMKKLREICDRHGLYLIEDNAHSFLSRSEGSFLGLQGDISILSFRKLIPVVNGAALLVNRPVGKGFLDDIRLASQSLPEEKRTRRLATFFKLLEARHSVPFSRLRKRELNLLAHGSTEQEAMDFSADAWSMSVLLSYRYGREAERRRANYRKWVERLEPKGFVPVKELDHETVPSGCPMYVFQRDKWLSYYLKKGFKVSPWPTLPLYVSRNHDSAVDIWRRLIVFTV